MKDSGALHSDEVAILADAILSAYSAGGSRKPDVVYENVRADMIYTSLEPFIAPEGSHLRSCALVCQSPVLDQSCTAGGWDVVEYCAHEREREKDTVRVLI